MYKRGVQSIVAFKAIDSTDGQTGKTGLAVTCAVSKDGAAFAGCTNSATETGRGWYQVVLTAAEMAAESVVLDCTATGAIIAGVPIHTESDYTAARAAKLDGLTFTVAGQVDANIKSVAGTTVNGAGTAGSPWGP